MPGEPLNALQTCFLHQILIMSDGLQHENKIFSLNQNSFVLFPMKYFPVFVYLFVPYSLV